MGAVSNDHVDPRRGGHPRRGKLGAHAPGAPAAARCARQGQHLFGKGGHGVDEPGVGMLVRVLVKEAVDVAQKHQQIRAAQLGHDGGKGVVVSQHLGRARFDLGGVYGVVFVDDGDTPQLKQRREGGRQMGGADGVGHVGGGEEDLGYRVAILPEKLVVKVHHLTLAHGGGRLLLPQLGGPAGEIELARSDADGPRGHQHHPVAHVAEVAQCPGQAVHVREIELAVFSDEGRGAHLYRDQLGVHVLFAPLSGIFGYLWQIQGR